MPIIRVDQDVYRHLQQQAKPFVDTPNEVLRRVLDVDAQHSSESEEELAPVRTGGRRRLNRTPEGEFRLPILQALDELGGSAPTADALEAVHEKMRQHLSEDDYGKLPKTGETRWRNNAMWARKRLKEEGLLRSDSPHGVWQLSDKGRQAARTSRSR